MTSRARERSRSTGRRLLPLAGVLSLVGCTPDPFVGPPLAMPRTGAGTWTGLAQEILVPGCASCHGGSSPTYFPRVDAEGGWAAMVNVRSQQVVMDLVKPGAPEESWLVFRLTGERGGQVMPPGDPLTAEELAAVEGWIAKGAPND